MSLARVIKAIISRKAADEVILAYFPSAANLWACRKKIY